MDEGLWKLASAERPTWVLPPVLAAQYHFAGGARRQNGSLRTKHSDLKT